MAIGLTRLPFFQKRLPLSGLLVLAVISICQAESISTPTAKPTYLYTDAELYVKDAWKEYRQAEKKEADQEERWRRAVTLVDLMMEEHPDWIDTAKQQNQAAKTSGESFPYKGQTNLKSKQIKTVYEKYWALYHIGTAEFIRVVSYIRLRDLARQRKDNVSSLSYEYKARNGARRLSQDYFYAQSLDPQGWFWQPVHALRDYVDFYY